MKIISWNMAHKKKPWECLLGMDIDLALLQEAIEPPPDVMKRIEADPAIEVNPGPWETMMVGGKPKWRTAIVKLSDRIGVEWITAKPLAEAKDRDDLVVSRPGTLAAAVVTPPSGDPVLVVSMYAQWARTHSLASVNCIFADGSAHHLVSDVSALVANRTGHRILAAGDMNILRAYGEHGDPYWAARYQTVFDRMEALGLACVGPEHAYGRRADPWPDELPRGSRNVPTFFPVGKNPATATRQLDYVFASGKLAESLVVRALNGVEEWGPSDHCRIQIDLLPCGDGDDYRRR